MTFSTADGTYQPADYVNDIVQMFFREASSGQKLSRWRRHVQVQAVQRLLQSWGMTMKEDSHAYVTMALQQIQQRVRNAGGDAATRAHYKDIDMQITSAFEN